MGSKRAALCQVVQATAVFCVLMGTAAPRAGAAAQGAAEFRFVEGADYLDLMYGDRPIYRNVTPVYQRPHHAETFKVYHHVYGFHGEGFLTKGLGGENAHHHGLFLGWYKTRVGADTIDIWHGAAGAYMRHVGYLPERELKGARARRASVSEWVRMDGKALVRDTREVTATLEDGKLYLDWALTLACATADSVVLDGDPAHAGFHFRADTTIKTFEYLGPADKSAAGDDWTMKPANSWIMGKFALQGHAYAVMQMDHPLNPRPVIGQKRDYGRWGHFFRATIQPGKPVTFYFRTLVLDVDKLGSPDLAQAQAYYDAYAKADPVSIGGAVPTLSGARGPVARYLLSTGPVQDLMRERQGAGLPVLDAFSLQGRRLKLSPAAAPAAAGVLILGETSR
ncbi:MAG: hypothetical protein JWP91_3570 [Fibrobacteres bacterium]|nr:hypothetical protein [Fibrobacterota bacterium]